MIPGFASVIEIARAWWLAAAMVLSVALLGAFTYRATHEWQRSATLLAERRAQQGADLLALALTRDMRAAQASVLSSQDWNGSSGESASEASRLLASAFARFPYPEVFFSWREDAPSNSVQFFARLDRTPSWIDSEPNEDEFPVAIGSSVPIAKRLVDRIVKDARDQRRFSIFDTGIDGIAYQVVCRLRYADPAQEHLQSIVGFMVNLDWAREHYFTNIVQQVARIAGTDSALAFSLAPTPEGEGSAAAAEGAPPEGRRALLIAFFDPLLVAIDRPADLNLEQWTIRAVAARDEMLHATSTGARRTLFVTALAAIVFTAGLALSLRAMREHANLAQLRADFVSTVTHELKTPVATIRAAGDTLVSHRVTISDNSRKYAHIVVEQTKQLTRLLDNLLAYARITDVTETYSFRRIEVSQLVDEILKNSKSRLESGGFDITVTIPGNLPPVRADRTAMNLALENLLDNAIRYSKEQRWLNVAACVTHDAVRIDIADHGLGIPADELDLVIRRFFRGAASGTGGSGLGLAIAQRIVSDHGGTLGIQSAVGVGTTVSVTLPVSRT